MSSPSALLAEDAALYTQVLEHTCDHSWKKVSKASCTIGRSHKDILA